jgi:hypothetical protein
VKIKILDDSRVEAIDYGKGSRFYGSWNVLYDQALLVTLDNGVRYIANFRHNIKDKRHAGQITNVWKSKPLFDMECD